MDNRIFFLWIPFKAASLAAFFLFCCTVLHAQSITYGTDDGLSNEWISDIIEDETGYIWLASQYGLNRFDGYEFEVLNYNPLDTLSLTSNWVQNIVSDEEHGFYINCFYGDLMHLDPKTKEIVFIKLPDGKSIPLPIRSLVVDRDKNLWIGTNRGLFIRHHDSKLIEEVCDHKVIDFDELGPSSFVLLTKRSIFKINGGVLTELKFNSSLKIRKIFVDQSKQIWALSGDELLKLEIIDNSLKYEIFPINDINPSSLFVKTAIYEDHLGQIWIAGDSSINIINQDRSLVEHIPFEKIWKTDHPILEVLTFYEDSALNMWIGTDRGLTLISPFHKRFSIPANMQYLQNEWGVRNVSVGLNHTWFANEKGLLEFAKDQNYRTGKYILEGPIFSICYTKNGSLYVAKDKNVYLRKKGENKFSIISDPNFAGGLTWDIVEDHRGFIWFSSLAGLSRYNPNSSTFININPSNNESLHSAITLDLLVDHEGQIWGTTLKSGIYKLTNTHEVTDPASAKFKNYAHIKGNPKSLSSNITLVMAIDQEGAIWLATDGGLNKINPNDSIEIFTLNNEMPFDKFVSLQVDDQNVLWGSGIGNGLMAMDLNNNQRFFFDKSDGLVSNNFLINSGFIDEEGYLYFGSDSETQIIDTRKALDFKRKDSKLKFDYINFPSQDNQSTEARNIFPGEEIRLPHDKSSFNISFTTLHFFQSEKTVYYYQLIGIHDRWQQNGTSRSININGLPQGKYTLKVKAKSPLYNFEPEELSLKIIIDPPWWKSTWAYILYLLLTLLAGYLIFKRHLEIIEANKIKEINELKSRLYANITHEIRTPLTVILGLSKKLMHEQKTKISEASKIIQRNGQHLLLLVNRILDLSKIESGEMSVNYIQDDIVFYTSYLLESFQSLSEEKDIKIHFISKLDKLIMDLDEELLKLIVNNLMSNAIKYVKSGGDIYFMLQQESDHLILEIQDNGPGIKPAKLPQIFDRFYQVKASQNSSGIGLTITKELVELLDGKISVKNNRNHKGCTFSVKLPITNLAPTPLKNKTSPPRTLKTEVFTDHLDKIVVVDDNDDVRNYILECLRGQYEIFEASNGKDGFDLIKEIMPDLIVSDIMMPVMDGMQMCKLIKKDPQTDHIPIIMLTAKADRQSKLEGLSLGAEEYLSKPFDKEELEIRIDNLLFARKKLIDKLKTNLDQKSLDADQVNPFVREVINLIEANLSDASFGINQICKQLAISRVHLHRKLKALTGESASIFIRNIRLKKAKHLLLNEEKNISEIAFELGFNDPAYFSKLFSEKFGESPSRFRKSSS